MVWANFEHKGKGDPALWADFYALIADLDPHILARAEMQGAADNGNAGLYAAEKALTPPGQPWLRPLGWLGSSAVAGNRTALFLRPDVFEPVSDWEHERGQLWGIPPANLTVGLVRYPGDPDCRRKICVAAAHHHYASLTGRALEAPELTKLADKRDTRDRTEACPNGRPCEAIVFYDANSYPADRLAGDVELPDLNAIPDKRHRVHRGIRNPDGTYSPDCESDRLLREAGLEDVARYLAVNDPTNIARYLAATTRGYPEQGGPGRIDRAGPGTPRRKRRGRVALAGRGAGRPLGRRRGRVAEHLAGTGRAGGPRRDHRPASAVERAHGDSPHRDDPPARHGPADRVQRARMIVVVVACAPAAASTGAARRRQRQQQHDRALTDPMDNTPARPGPLGHGDVPRQRHRERHDPRRT
jgi:hypothetical protein